MNLGYISTDVWLHTEAKTVEITTMLDTEQNVVCFVHAAVTKTRRFDFKQEASLLDACEIRLEALNTPG